jgi:hypothetical protein
MYLSLLMCAICVLKECNLGNSCNLMIIFSTQSYCEYWLHIVTNLSKCQIRYPGFRKLNNNGNTLINFQSVALQTDCTLDPLSRIKDESLTCSGPTSGFRARLPMEQALHRLGHSVFQNTASRRSVWNKRRQTTLISRDSSCTGAPASSNLHVRNI